MLIENYLDRTNMSTNILNNLGIESFYDIAERNPKYVLANKLVNILEAIAICQSRIDSSVRFSKENFGVNADGSIPCTDHDYRTVQKYTKIKNRLQQYYNNKLTLLQPYKSK